jgi:hypothetical protein
MIYLGYNDEEKKNVINNYIKDNKINNIYFITNEDLNINIDYDNIKYVVYKNIMKYAYYYRIIENTTRKTLIIINEILKDRNRYNLTYNCIRVFLNNTNHILIFNYFPIIYNREDFCSLIDFDTQTRFKYYKLKDIDFNILNIECKKIDLKLNKIYVSYDLFGKDTYLKSYLEYKEDLFKNFSSKDVHVLPRKLQLFTSKIKNRFVKEKCISRTKSKKNVSFKSLPKEKLKIIDLPFNMVDLINYLYLSKIKEINVITTGFKVDLWFEDRVEKFIKELKYIYDKI